MLLLVVSDILLDELCLLIQSSWVDWHFKWAEKKLFGHSHKHLLITYALVHQKHISSATDTFLQSFLLNPPVHLLFLYILRKYHADTQMVERFEAAEAGCRSVFFTDCQISPLFNCDTLSCEQTLEMPAWILMVHVMPPTFFF